MTALWSVTFALIDVGVGFWLRGFLDRKREDRRLRYRWRCPHCDFEIRGSDPALAARFTTRHVCGKPPTIGEE